MSVKLPGPQTIIFHEEMVEQYGRVRRFLPHLLNTVKFSSAPAGVTTLNACDYLSREFSSRRQFLTTHQRKLSVGHGNGW
uniref:TnpA transposase n=1 Tax=Klebsiella pneumoniae TaxID=573 RepID=A0A8B0SZC1_KLEPN|nr:TnpA transposase [Klebsiella pneumoniae]